MKKSPSLKNNYVIDIFSDHEKTLSIQSELNDVKEQHEAFEMEWLELNEELEQL